MIHEYKIPFNDLLELFDLSKNTEDTINEYVNDDEWQSHLYHFQEYLNDDNYDFHDTVRDIIEKHVRYESINEYILEEVESFFNNEVARCFDTDIEIKLKEHNYEEVTLQIISDNLKNQIGEGMDGYGEWNWSLHSPEDQQKFVDDGYLALRELLHYYEACESKPRVRLDRGTDHFWDYDTTLDKIKEEIDAAKSRSTSDSNE